MEDRGANKRDRKGTGDHHSTAAKRAERPSSSTWSVSTLQRKPNPQKPESKPAPTNPTVATSYPCREGSCGKKFASRASLARHVREVHADPSPFICTSCGECFTRKFSLDRHADSHRHDRKKDCTKPQTSESRSPSTMPPEPELQLLPVPSTSTSPSTSTATPRLGESR
ncbi:zinc finger protein 48-like [Patiria miniata]|uniref:C2H2-type domain-containing protein n=1 Tax=Patiria miniata TaxID=46514 RepID=A0A914BA84_PATMI|nr:zinc finger protein 48-like [Patiria miniata]